MYISYKDVKPTDEYKVDHTYENYIYFNKNIITKDTTNFYDYEGNLKYTIKSSGSWFLLSNGNLNVGYDNENLKHRLYINADYDTTYKFLNLFCLIVFH